MVKRGLKFTLLALPWVLTFLFGWLWLASTLNLSFADIGAESARANRENARRFVAQLGPDCVSRQMVIDAAEARGWDWRDEPGGYRGCVRPEGLGNWLSVEVQPPLMMSSHDENARYFGFDSHGCMAPWANGRGPGTTCPDR